MKLITNIKMFQLSTRNPNREKEFQKKSLDVKSLI